MYKVISDTDRQYFFSILPEGRMLEEEEDIMRCASDHTEDLVFRPELVLQPGTGDEVSRILSYCNKQLIPVTVRGAGTGLSGGCLPVHGGVVLDMKRMNRILNIDTQNFQVTTEPGVITEELQNMIKAKGLFYPVDPASRGSCFIGGNVAENSGGPRAVKYGVVKDYVLNLEVVLPNGDIIWTGANTLKNATGYNLTQLIVGSEGTLAVITKIVLRLIPLPAKSILLLVPFRSATDAAVAVNRIFLAGHTPSALEFMERDAIIMAGEYLETDTIPVTGDIQAHLLIELDGNDTEQLYKEAAGITAVLDHFVTGDIRVAETEHQKSEMWRLRRIIGEAVKRSSVYKEEDTVIPRAALPCLLDKVKQLGQQYGFRSVCYGHAGDGNLHVNILKGNMDDDKWKQELPAAIRELFIYVHSLGGTISGEHGIGFVQKPYMDIVISPGAKYIMEGIKRTFDPNGILNPGKILESS